MQLSLIVDTTTSEPAPPTIASLNAGDCFRRKELRHTRFLYMIVDFKGIRAEGYDDRTYPIVNLSTGGVFFCHGYEEIEPLEAASVVEDVTKYTVNIERNLSKKLAHAKPTKPGKR